MRVFFKLSAAVVISCLTGFCAYGQTGTRMDLSLVRTGSNSATHTQHYKITGTAVGNFVSSGYQSWGTSNITIRVPKVINLNTGGTVTLSSTLANGTASTYITNVTSNFTAFGYADFSPYGTAIPTSGASGSVALFDLADVGGTSDGYVYFTVSSTASNNQVISNGTTINVLQFDLPDTWGTGHCPDCISIVTANAPGAFVDIETSIVNSGTGAANIANIVTSTAPLPVRLVSFEASKLQNEKRVELDWTTANEQGCNYFEVERSGNGKDFNTVVAHVKATGNTTVEQKYISFDEKPIDGNNYYRLKMVDFSGDLSYGPVRIINFNGQSVLTPEIFPNPATDIITVAGINKGCFVRFLAVDGKLMATVSAQSDYVTVNSEAWPSGFYEVQIFKNGLIVSRAKIVKK